jgi:hypothetical protein
MASALHRHPFNLVCNGPRPDFVAPIKMYGPPLGVKQKNSKLAEVVCKKPVLIKGTVSLKATIFYDRFGARR